LLVDAAGACGAFAARADEATGADVAVGSTAGEAGAWIGADAAIGTVLEVPAAASVVVDAAAGATDEPEAGAPMSSVFGVVSATTNSNS